MQTEVEPFASGYDKENQKRLEKVQANYKMNYDARLHNQ